MNQWTRHDDEYGLLLAALTRLAQDHGYVLNPEPSRVEKVVGLMTDNLAATGRKFCPCKQSHPLDPTKDVICPCPEWQADIERNGHCFCRLFFKPGGE